MTAASFMGSGVSESHERRSIKLCLRHSGGVVSCKTAATSLVPRVSLPSSSSVSIFACFRLPHSGVLCQSLVLSSKKEMWRGFLRHLLLKAWILFSQSASREHVSQPYRRMEVTRALYSTAIINGPEEGEVQCLYPSTSQYRLSGSTPAYPNVG